MNSLDAITLDFRFYQGHTKWILLIGTGVCKSYYACYPRILNLGLNYPCYAVDNEKHLHKKACYYEHRFVLIYLDIRNAFLFRGQRVLFICVVNDTTYQCFPMIPISINI